MFSLKVFHNRFTQILIILIIILLIRHQFINARIEKYLAPQKSLPISFHHHAEISPSAFKRDFLKAFDRVSEKQNSITVNNGFNYRHGGDHYSSSTGLKYDTNHDGEISLLELERSRQKSRYLKDYFTNPYKFPSYISLLMVFDTDNDGILHRHELIKGVDELTYQKCPFPTLSNEIDLIFIGASNGIPISSISVSDQSEETKVSKLIINKGSTPLYIVAIAENPMIWQIEGDINRITSFVTKGNVSRNRDIKKLDFPNVGVIGLPRNKVHFINKRCLANFSGQRHRTLETAKKIFYRKLGRSPLKTFGEYTVHNMFVPNGFLGPNQEILDPNTMAHYNAWRKIQRIQPKNIMQEIKIADILSPGEITHYEIYPGRFGLRQLIKSGHLVSEGSSYKVLKPFPHYPAGLYGSNAVHFKFKIGMPQPKGNKGHSKISYYF